MNLKVPIITSNKIMFKSSVSLNKIYDVMLEFVA